MFSVCEATECEKNKIFYSKSPRKRAQEVNVKSFPIPNGYTTFGKNTPKCRNCGHVNLNHLNNEGKTGRTFGKSQPRCKPENPLETGANEKRDSLLHLTPCTCMRYLKPIICTQIFHSLNECLFAVIQCLESCFFWQKEQGISRSNFVILLYNLFILLIVSNKD